MRTVFYFTADWCNPCKKVRPIVEEIKRDNSDIKFQIIDADIELSLVKMFSIQSIPTFILLDEGLEISRMNGAQSKEHLLSFIYQELDS